MSKNKNSLFLGAPPLCLFCPWRSQFSGSLPWRRVGRVGLGAVVVAAVVAVVAAAVAAAVEEWEGERDLSDLFLTG